MRIRKRPNNVPTYRIMDKETGFILHGFIDSKQGRTLIWKPKSDFLVARLFYKKEHAEDYATRVGLTNVAIIDDCDNIVVDDFPERRSV